MDLSMEKVLLLIYKKIGNIKDFLKRIKWMEMEYLHGMIILNFKDNSLIM